MHVSVGFSFFTRQARKVYHKPMTTETDQHDGAGGQANTTHRHRAHYSDAGTTTRTTTTTTVATSETATTSQRTKRLRERLLPIKSASQMCSPSEQRSHLKSLQSTEAGTPFCGFPNGLVRSRSCLLGVTVSKVAGSLVFSVGHYRVQNLLGSGGAGRVYAGLDTRTGQTVALKICSKQLTNKQLARLQTEYKVMSNLEHRHIIKLHGVFENDSRMCLVMDYAEGGDLFDYIKSSGRLPRDECRRLFRQLASALSHMHSKGTTIEPFVPDSCLELIISEQTGYMHRDIKPENCLLDKQKNILLADFGFSNVWSSYKAETEGLGSLNFASPEIITSTASYIGPEVVRHSSSHLSIGRKLTLMSYRTCGVLVQSCTQWSRDDCRSIPRIPQVHSARFAEAPGLWTSPSETIQKSRIFCVGCSNPTRSSEQQSGT